MAFANCFLNYWNGFEWPESLCLNLVCLLHGFKKSVPVETAFESLGLGLGPVTAWVGLALVSRIDPTRPLGSIRRRQRAEGLGQEKTHSGHETCWGNDSCQEADNGQQDSGEDAACENAQTQISARQPVNSSVQRITPDSDGTRQKNAGRRVSSF